ncbi:IGHE protein, partial [Vidua macroura]|nr:IGHE protein [Vidua macroura]
NFRQIFSNFPDFSPSAGKRLPPSVFLLPPPAEELSSSRPTLSLTCLARGFFPDAIDVQWQRDQEILGGSGDPSATPAGSSAIP